MRTYVTTLAIGQVTGVVLTCEPVGLINQCTVMWQVSSLGLAYWILICWLAFICTYVRTYVSVSYV